MPCQLLTITLIDTDQEALEKLANRPSTPQQIAQHARIVLEASAGKNNAEIAPMLGVSIKMVRQWRKRWVHSSEQSAITLQKDCWRNSRPGAPLKFTRFATS